MRTTSSADAEHRVGHRLPHPHPGQLGDLVVERLEVLDVDGREDVDPGREHVGDVFVALLVLEARRVGVGELVDQRQLGRAGEQRRQVHLLDARRRGSATAAARHHLQPARLVAGLLAFVRLQVADHDVAAGRRLRPGPPAASGRSCRPRRPCRGRSCSGRGCICRRLPPQAPSRLWTTRSISLIPTKGTIRPPRP